MHSRCIHVYYHSNLVEIANLRVCIRIEYYTETLSYTIRPHNNNFICPTGWFII